MWAGCSAVLLLGNQPPTPWGYMAAEDSVYPKVHIRRGTVQRVERRGKRHMMCRRSQMTWS